MQNQLNSSISQWTIIKIIQWATSYLKKHDIDSPRATGEILLAHALGVRRIDLYLNHDQPLVADELKQFKVLIKRRIKREPVAYILGAKEFWSLELEVRKDVLVPRPETECLVEAALNLLPMDTGAQPQRILDLGTGSGAIVLALAAQKPQHIYFASDESIEALELACRNARRHNLSEKIRFFASDWMRSLDPTKEGFDMIVSNPPYIPSQVILELQPEINLYEPLGALDGGTDGLSCLRDIIGRGHHYLKTGGILLLEIAHDQQNDVYRIASNCDHYEDFNCTKDYSGYDRVVWMRKKSR